MLLNAAGMFRVALVFAVLWTLPAQSQSAAPRYANRFPSIQAALDVGPGTVIVPDGNYEIDCDSSKEDHGSFGGIAPKSRTHLILGSKATLKCKPNTSGYYVLIRLKD